MASLVSYAEKKVNGLVDESSEISINLAKKDQFQAPEFKDASSQAKADESKKDWYSRKLETQNVRASGRRRGIRNNSQVGHD
jgi:hypothetical protein